LIVIVCALFSSETMVSFNTTTTVGGVSFAVCPEHNGNCQVNVVPAEDGETLKLVLKNFTGSIDIKELVDKLAPVKADDAIISISIPQKTPKPLRKARDSILSPFSEDEAPKMSIPDEDSEVDGDLDVEYESTQQNELDDSEFKKGFNEYSEIFCLVLCVPRNHAA
jgi:hypothetical protein